MLAAVVRLDNQNNSELAADNVMANAIYNVKDLITLPQDWHEHLAAEIEAPYFKKLCIFLQKEMNAKKDIFPPQEFWFSALAETPFAKVKVVILGQDPYHGLGQAHGLSFSVKPPNPWPPSLQNIFKELDSDLKISHSDSSIHSGDLTSWARQGVLLLNSVLTVEQGKAGSHQKKGWEMFTDRLIEVLAQKRENLVFVLWGSYAQNKCSKIDESKHLIIRSPHPSPLSSYRGFFGSKPFSKINDWLAAKHIAPIQWT